MGILQKRGLPVERLKQDVSTGNPKIKIKPKVKSLADPRRNAWHTPKAPGIKSKDKTLSINKRSSTNKQTTT